MKKLMIVILVLVSSAMYVNAQKNFEIHGGFSMPTGAFAETVFDHQEEHLPYDYGVGCATTGINLGVKYYLPLSFYKGLSLGFGVDFILNGVNSELKEVIKDFHNAPGADISYSKYINVPIIVGLNYILPVSNNISLYADAGIGLNYFTMSNMKESGMYKEYDDFTGVYSYEDYENTIDFGSSTKFCTKIGIGIDLKDKYKIGLSYFWLGGHLLDRQETYVDADGTGTDDDDRFGTTLKVGTFTITFGYRFDLNGKKKTEVVKDVAPN